MPRSKSLPPTRKAESKTQAAASPALAELQTALSGVFRAPPGERDGPVLDTIQAPPRGVLSDRIHVYANGYFLRLRDALADDFEATRKLLGRDFDRIAFDYFKKFPSTSPLIANAGERFAEFVARHPLAKKNPLAAELARVEWLAVLSFYAPEDMRRIENIPNVAPELWSEARFTLHPSVILHRAEWPVVELWKERQGDDAYGRVPKRASPEKILIHKNERWVMLSRLSDVEFDVLNFMQRGLALGEILLTLETQGNLSDEGALNWQGAFERWTRDGVLVQVGFGA